MKALITLMFVCLIGSIYGQNSIYLDQISTSATDTITQTGSSNRIGTSSNRSSISGDSGTFTISQIGSSNALDFNLTGNSYTFSLTNTGDSNTLGLFLNGNSNTFSTTFTGSSNSMVLNSDGTSSGTKIGRAHV